MSNPDYLTVTISSKQENAKVSYPNRTFFSRPKNIPIEKGFMDANIGELILENNTELPNQCFRNSKINQFTISREFKINLQEASFTESKINNLLINNNANLLGRGCFYGSSIESLVIGNINTLPNLCFSYAKIKQLEIGNIPNFPDKYAVFFEAQIEELIIQENVNVLSKNQFFGAKIGNISIPKTVTEIKSLCFFCAEIEKTIELPETIEKVGEFAFSNFKGSVNVLKPKQKDLLIKAGLNENQVKVVSRVFDTVTGHKQNKEFEEIKKDIDNIFKPK
tara:strand:+ start:2104 stop:2940 length:837 start_codon:yes stop_codon:yes gene_type:complete